MSKGSSGIRYSEQNANWELRADTKPEGFKFMKDGKVMCKFDGNAVFSIGPDVTVEEAAQGFVEAVNKFLQSYTMMGFGVNNV